LDRLSLAADQHGVVTEQVMLGNRFSYSF